ncbi:response regulator [Paraburkholderia sp. BR14320]|uniref:response regulator n=1 Tax=unclassified Paraburkholderia TaxID=2615204 RepID=UPI0034CEBC0D
MEQRPKVVLLAEDDAQSAAAWMAVLRQNGFEVVWAPDGAAALALAQLATPDLLVTDWSMPGLDGLGLCVAFRADPSFAAVPIILTSSEVFTGGPETTLHNLFVQKPVNAVGLIAAVSALMKAPSEK